MEIPKKESHRIEKVNSLIEHIIADIFAKELEFPVGTFPNVTKAETSEDLEHTKVWIAVLPKEKRKEVLNFLQENIYEIQGFLNERFKMKKKPRIRFMIDEREDKAERVEELIDKIHRE